MNKSKLVKILKYNDIKIDIEQIDQIINLIEDNTQLSNDGIYIFDDWDIIHEIEEITDLRIDDIFNNWSFNDSYTICAHCYNAISLLPQCNGDINDYWFDTDNCEHLCGDCVRSNIDFTNEYIESLINNDQNANTILDLKNYGFEICKCNNDACSFWAGIRNQSSDNPKEILERAQKRNDKVDYVFDITGLSMFDIEYTLYHKNKDQ